MAPRSTSSASTRKREWTSQDLSQQWKKCGAYGLCPTSEGSL